MGENEEQQLLARLREEHGDIKAIRTRSGVLVVVKTPSRAAYKRFYKAATDTRGKEDKATATEQLCYDSVCHPPLAELKQLLERRPGLIDKISDLAVELANDDPEDVEGN